MADHPTTTTQPLKFITGSDSYGCTLKDALVSHLRFLNIEVEDLGVAPYYSMSENIGQRVAAGGDTTRGLLACGTGVGVQIFANKVPGVYAATRPRTPGPSTTPTS
uniref:Uncharacterized protein n=1 Tax=Chenopodium quinoa TaxID=63459 RepID=A0A803KPM4_CHEQI